MFRGVKYYDSADIMPIGRYMLAICRDIKFFAIGDKPKNINKRKLTKAIQRFNNSILKNQDQKQVLKEINNLTNDECKIYMQSALVAIIEYCNLLIEVGADKHIIQEHLKPIRHLLVERGLTPDSRRNKQRLEKVSRNFKIKSDEIRQRLRNENIESSQVYEKYLRNLVIIEKTFGVKINEQTDSVNKYVMLIDELNRYVNRLKQNVKS